MKIYHLLTAALLACNFSTIAQTDSTIENLQKLPAKYFSEADKKFSALNDKLTKKSIGWLQKLERREKKLRRQFEKTDAVDSNLFKGIKYDVLKSQVNKVNSVD